ncbi:MAG: bifunctional hydroxymethylpyrimidine kinase/phosphomethylpyrimidine kinase [Xanthomonadales bacterium]|jgi:hydroxymethylpyrimidine/phosphomethylpyrimidine kinase|nr:bifunctional hydroxymethylpyrimidine kinase/phosphomethylpyrimidine kinase [Xanthomonadales bacterium]
MQTPVIESSVLTIAGSDSCGGAGIQADLNTFAAFGVYGASVITAVTARNTLGVQALEPVSDALIVAQMESVLEDLPIRAIKTGLLPSVAAIAILGEMLEQHQPLLPMVVDPVVIEPDERKLSGEAALEAIQNHLFPLATLITPNLEEARVLTGMAIRDMDEMAAAAHELLDRGPYAVFLKGGRFGGLDITDILLTRDGMHRYTHPAFEGRFHGTGCALSSAVAAGLAMDKTLPEAVQDAVEYVQACLENSLSPIKGRLGLLGHKARF